MPVRMPVNAYASWLKIWESKGSSISLNFITPILHHVDCLFSELQSTTITAENSNEGMTHLGYIESYAFILNSV